MRGYLIVINKKLSALHTKLMNEMKCKLLYDSKEGGGTTNFPKKG